MLTSVPSSWPRIFNVLAIGAIGLGIILGMVLYHFSVFPAEANPSTVSEVWKTEMFPSRLGQMALVAGPLFAVYLIGEILLMAGYGARQRRNRRFNNATINAQFARVVHLDNNVLTGRVARLADNAELFDGLAYCSLLFGILVVVQNLIYGEWIIAVIISAASTGVWWIFTDSASDYLVEIDDFLSAVESKQDSE